MKKIIYAITILTTCFFVSFGIVSCGGDAEIDNYKNIIKNSTTEADTIKATRDYLFYVVSKEQENQQKNAKKINADNLLNLLDTLNSVEKKYPTLLSSIYVRISQATATMLLGAYSESKSELVEAVEFVQAGIDGLDSLMRDYPNNMAVRAYRIINYSNLPPVFGKEKIVEKDVAIFLPFLAEISGLPAFEKGLFQAVLERLEIFYGELDNAERVAEVQKMLEHLQTMETVNDSASIINQ